VKSVSLAFPFPFFFLSVDAFPLTAGDSRASLRPALPDDEGPVPHALTAGVDGPPPIFRRLLFPPTKAFGTTVGVEIGNAGNSDLGNDVGLSSFFLALSWEALMENGLAGCGALDWRGCDGGGGCALPEAAADQGVVRWAIRCPCTELPPGRVGYSDLEDEGPAVAEDVALGTADRTVPGRIKGPVLGPDEDAARSTRSQTLLGDPFFFAPALTECLMFRTRPALIPA